MSDADPYLDARYGVFRNKLGITDPDVLDYTEREFVTQRAAQGIPAGRFDLHHLCAIHRHLFQDIYDWAGQIRTVEISKDGHQFQFRRSIETGMADVHRRLVGAKLEQLTAQAGHTLELGRIDPQAWLLASEEAHVGRYGAMADEILRILRPA